MSVRLYAPPLPRGGWVLSFAILFTGFFLLRDEDANKSASKADNEHVPRKHGEQQHNATASSPAYQTDEEAGSATRENRKRYQRATSPNTPSNTPDTSGSTLLGKTWTGDRNVNENSGLESDGHHPAVFVAAATAAASAVRKSHLAYLDSATRWRVEREAFRIRVHEHVQRELRRRSIEAAGALASVVL